MKTTPTLLALLAAMIAGSAARAAPANDDSGAESDSVRYFVLGTDVSGSMVANDARIRIGGRETVWRDEAQFLFLSVLPELFNDCGIGVIHFTDRPVWASPGSGPNGQLKAGEAPLTPWSQRVSGEGGVERTRNLIRSVQRMERAPTDLLVPMEFARQRVRAARERTGPGRAMLVLLSDGDPQGAVDAARRRAVVEGAGRLKADGIEVQAVIINRGSFRPGEDARPLTDADKAAEGLLAEVAERTGGKVYRITKPDSMKDAFLTMTNVTWPSIGQDSVVSTYHRSVMYVGPRLAGVEIESRDKTRRVMLGVQDGRDAATGIEVRSATVFDLMVAFFYRPPGAQQVERFWDADWRFIPAVKAPNFFARGQGVADFTVVARVVPDGEAFEYENLKIYVALARRPPVPGEAGEAGEVPLPRLPGGLVPELSIDDGGGGKPIILVPEWDAAKQRWVFAFQPKLHDAAKSSQRQSLRVQVKDGSSANALPLAETTQTVTVRKVPVQFRILHADRVQYQSPRPPEPPVKVTARGGDDVLFEVVVDGGGGGGGGEGAVDVGRLRARVEVLGADPARPVRVDLQPMAGRLRSAPFRLPVEDSHLAGRVVVEIDDGGDVRPLSLPSFDFDYNEVQPVAVLVPESERTEVWAGEWYRAKVRYELTPVANKSRERYLRHLRAGPSTARVRVVGARGGDKVLPVTIAPVGEPVFEPAAAGRPSRLWAKYEVTVNRPLPREGQLVLDLGDIVPGMGAQSKPCPIFDPDPQTQFRWKILQPGQPDQLGVPQSLSLNTLTTFQANWSVDRLNIQNIEARVEPIGDPIGSLTFNDPAGVAGLDRKTIARELTAGDINHGTDAAVRVKVTYLPRGSRSPVTVELDGGRTYVQLQDFVLQALDIGKFDGRALCVARIPITLQFALDRHDPALHEKLAQLKRSLQVTLAYQSQQDGGTPVTPQLTWAHPAAKVAGARSLQAEEWDEQVIADTNVHVLTNAVYVPLPRQGKAAVNVSITTPAMYAQQREQYAEFNVSAPPFRLTLAERQPAGEPTLVFDSEAFARTGEGARRISPALGTQLTAAVEGDPTQVMTLRLRCNGADRGLTPVGTAGEPQVLTLDTPGVWTVGVSSPDPRLWLADLAALDVATVGPFTFDLASGVAPPEVATAAMVRWPFRMALKMQSAVPSPPPDLDVWWGFEGLKDFTWQSAAAKTGAAGAGEFEITAGKVMNLLPVSSAAKPRAAFTVEVREGEVVRARWTSLAVRVAAPLAKTEPTPDSPFAFVVKCPAVPPYRGLTPYKVIARDAATGRVLSEPAPGPVTNDEIRWTAHVPSPRQQRSWMYWAFLSAPRIGSPAGQKLTVEVHYRREGLVGEDLDVVEGFPHSVPGQSTPCWAGAGWVLPALAALGLVVNVSFRKFLRGGPRSPQQRRYTVEHVTDGSPRIEIALPAVRERREYPPRWVYRFEDLSSRALARWTFLANAVTRGKVVAAAMAAVAYLKSALFSWRRYAGIAAQATPQDGVVREPRLVLLSEGGGGGGVDLWVAGRWDTMRADSVEHKDIDLECPCWQAGKELPPARGKLRIVPHGGGRSNGG